MSGYTPKKDRNYATLRLSRSERCSFYGYLFHATASEALTARAMKMDN